MTQHKGCPWCGGEATAKEVNREHAPGWVHLTVVHRAGCLHKPTSEVLLLSDDELKKWDQRAPEAPAPQGWTVGQPITEEMHVAAVKVLHRAPGLDGLPQRMLDAMVAAAPKPPEQHKADERNGNQWRELFPIGVLGHPMREYAPGKWESAIWPSEAEKARAA